MWTGRQPVANQSLPAASQSDGNPLLVTRLASYRDAKLLADMHVRNLDTDISELTILGESVVTTFYANALSRSLAEAVLVIAEDDTAGGFVFVTTDVNKLFNGSLLAGLSDIARLLWRARPLGLVRLAITRALRRSLHIPAVAELVYIAIDPPYRGLGLGSRLVDAAERWFRERGVTYYELNVRASNLPAISLYLKKGLTIDRTYIRHGATFHTMGKMLEPGP